MGIVPQNWGPHVWAAIHLICLGAPEKFSSGDNAAYRVFFENLPNVLPCEVCKNHLIENLKNVPIDTALSGGRDALFAWSVKLHNTVNEMLEKPIIRYEDAIAYWNWVAKGGKIVPTNQTSTLSIPSKNGCVKTMVLMAIILIVGIMLGMYMNNII